MRAIERHQTGTAELWNDNYTAGRARIESLKQSLAELPDAAGSLAQLGAEQMALASLWAGRESEMCQGVSLASRAAAAAFVSAAQADGNVRTVLGEVEITFPVTGPTSTAHIGTWLLGFSSAIIRRDQVAIGVLRSEASVEAALSSNTRGDRFWKPLALALAALTRSDVSGCQKQIAEGRRCLAQDVGEAVNPAFLQQTKAPLFELCARLAEGAVQGWDDAVVVALEAHRRFWGEADNAQDPFGFVALDITGLCALAHDRGIPTTVESAYLPVAFIEGRCTGPATQVSYVFPRQQIHDPSEAHEFMDQQGCPAEGRTHEIIEDDAGTLVAIYHCPSTGDGPAHAFEFELLDDVPMAAAVSAPSLDAGQHLQLADAAAKSVPASAAGLTDEERTRVRARLQEAVAHWQAILDFIPEGETRVPESAFWTPEGNAVRRLELGRFDRARLEAVLTAWQGILQSYGGEPTEETSQGSDAVREEALKYLEIVREQVQPILLALVRDGSGAIAAELAPRDEDYARVFVGEAVEVARRTYTALYSEGLDVPKPPSTQVEIRTFVAPAGMLAEENELSRHFPGGYRAIAHLLNPHRVWVAWKAVRPGETSGLAFDGLVWCDDHWAWFPKPFRALAPLVNHR